MPENPLNVPKGHNSLCLSIGAVWAPHRTLRGGLVLQGTDLEPIVWTQQCELDDVNDRVQLYCDFHDWTKSCLIQVDSMVMEVCNLQATLF